MAGSRSNSPGGLVEGRGSRVEARDGLERKSEAESRERPGAALLRLCAYAQQSREFQDSSSNARRVPSRRRIERYALPRYLRAGRELQEFSSPHPVRAAGVPPSLFITRTLRRRCAGLLMSAHVCSCHHLAQSLRPSARRPIAAAASNKTYKTIATAFAA